MKRIFVLFLAVTLAATSLLTACSPSEEEGGSALRGSALATDEVSNMIISDMYEKMLYKMESKLESLSVDDLYAYNYWLSVSTREEISAREVLIARLVEYYEYVILLLDGSTSTESDTESATESNTESSGAPSFDLEFEIDDRFVIIIPGVNDSSSSGVSSSDVSSDVISDDSGIIDLSTEDDTYEIVLQYYDLFNSMYDTYEAKRVEFLEANADEIAAYKAACEAEETALRGSTSETPSQYELLVLMVSEMQSRLYALADENLYAYNYWLSVATEEEITAREDLIEQLKSDVSVVSSMCDLSLYMPDGGAYIDSLALAYVSDALPFYNDFMVSYNAYVAKRDEFIEANAEEIAAYKESCESEGTPLRGSGANDASYDEWVDIYNEMQSLLDDLSEEDAYAYEYWLSVTSDEEIEARDDLLALLDNSLECYDVLCNHYDALSFGFPDSLDYFDEQSVQIYADFVSAYDTYVTKRTEFVEANADEIAAYQAKREAERDYNNWDDMYYEMKGLLDGLSKEDSDTYNYWLSVASDEEIAARNNIFAILENSVDYYYSILFAGDMNSINIAVLFDEAKIDYAVDLYHDFMTAYDTYVTERAEFVAANADEIAAYKAG